MSGAIPRDQDKNMEADAVAGEPDDDLARLVIDTMGPRMTARNRVVMTGLVRHLHAFAREVRLTHDEWMAGVDFVNSMGRIWSPTRNEALRVSDVLGLES